MNNADNQNESSNMEMKKVADVVKNRLKWCTHPLKIPHSYVALHENASILTNASGSFLCIPQVEDVSAY